MRLIERVRRYAAQHSLWSPGVRVTAAVSGGSDSVALFFLLRQLDSSGDLVLTGLAHLHHQIRGAAADADAAFCRHLAVRNGVPLVAAHADVPALAAKGRVSLEVAGRRARQQFFAEALSRTNAARIAVAHTRDDQAETVLLRLVRGAGATGLSGIAPARAHLIRPLLEVSRSDLRRFLAGIGEPWREDESNRDCAIPRNLIRHDVFPHLRTLNPQADAAIARTADILRTDDAFLDTLANEAALHLVRIEAAPRRVIIDAAGLRHLPLAIARRVARAALETTDPSRSYGLAEAEAVCAAAAGGAAATPAGVQVERSAAEVVLRCRSSDPVPRTVPAAEPFELQLDVPGVVRAPGGSWTMTAEGPMPRQAAGIRQAGQVVVDAGRLRTSLTVRPRRNGDRLKPLGASGHRKVQDVFVDRKVPRNERDDVPIVTDDEGRIVWVAGHVLADSFRVTPLTTTVVVLTLRRQ
jgi:tRNA(Ile)-lysidine synthase